MSSLHFSNNEYERLNALDKYAILDTFPEESFDRITELASIICDVPIALISLVDKERQWFKSKVGLDVDQTAREISFCQHAILGDDIFEVENANEDQRFFDNPLVTDNPNIRFYAGYPLTDPDGYNLGTLCVIDRKPKKLDKTQQMALKVLGMEVIDKIVARKKNFELRNYKELFNLSLDMITIAGSDGYFKIINPAFTEILGWSEQELLSKPFAEFIHPDDVEKTFTEVKKLSQGHKAVNFINRYRTKSGEYKVIDWATNPDVKTGNLYAIARDVSHSKLIEQDLTNAKNELKVTFDTITEGVVLQNEKGEIVNCNPAACKILKLSEDQLKGKKSIDPDWNCIREDGSPFPGEEHPSMIALKSGKSIYHVIMGVRIHHGDVTWISINAELMHQGKGVVVSFSDITERRLIEENKLRLVALDAANKLTEQTIKAKEEFLANMSHEIRTPMNSIIGLTNLLEKAGELSPKQHSYLDIIKINSENLLNIINDILDFSKLGSSEFKLEKTGFYFKDTVEGTLKSLGVLADRKHLVLKSDFDSKIPSYLAGDELRIIQVITNLLSNAIKFTENKGEVFLKASLVSENESKVAIEVKILDSGIGISTEKLDYILKPFTQETSSTTRQYGGTGLGLSIVSKILAHMGSALKIESLVGKGSVFSFVMEFEKAALPAEQDIKTIKKLNGKYSILLAEDNPFNQIVIIDTLKDWNPNLEMEIANNGKEVINWLESKHFDLILMDIQMPLMDGHETTIHIRDILKKSPAELPIIAMTAHISDLEIDTCLKNGMNNYISKPFQSEKLFDIISFNLYRSDKEELISEEPAFSEEINKEENTIVKIVDFEVLEEFTNGKHDLKLKMIHLFLSKTPEELKNIGESLDKKDYKMVISIIHSFYPKYIYMGMKALADKAREIEQLAIDQGNHQQMQYLFVDLNQKTELAFKELESYRKDLNPI